VNATRIVALVDLFRVAEVVTPVIKTSGLANLTLMKFYLLYLMRQAFDKDRLGSQLVRDPALSFVVRKERHHLGQCALEVLKDLVVDLEAEVEERESAQGPLDFKRLLKTEKEVRILTKDVDDGLSQGHSKEALASFYRTLGKGSCRHRRSAASR